jgi:hypothetical protein
VAPIWMDARLAGRGGFGNPMMDCRIRMSDMDGSPPPWNSPRRWQPTTCGRPERELSVTTLGISRVSYLALGTPEIGGRVVDISLHEGRNRRDAHLPGLGYDRDGRPAAEPIHAQERPEGLHGKPTFMMAGTVSSTVEDIVLNQGRMGTCGRWKGEARCTSALPHP